MTVVAVVAALCKAWRGNRAMASDEARGETGGTDAQRPPLPRSPLIIGGIAIGLMVWMLLVILLLIGWKLVS